MAYRDWTAWLWRQSCSGLRGEITGNFPENGLILSKLALSPAAISMLYGLISLPKLAGNFFEASRE
jgi:hypothetical protein